MLTRRFDRTRLACNLPAAIVLTLASLPAAADSAALSQELARCAGITTPQARLECYDALARRPHADTTAPVATSSAPQESAKDDARNFGLSPVQIQPKPVGPAAIAARLTEISFNQGEIGQSYLQLDNGEIWKTRDDVARLAVGNLVKIKRGALGSFLLLDPANLSYRVFRVK